MMKQGIVHRITRKTVKTKFGEKWKLGILLKTDKGEVWLDAWENFYTKTLKEGDAINAEISSREYQGKTYYSLVTPDFQAWVYGALNEILDALGKAAKTKVELPRVERSNGPDRGAGEDFFEGDPKDEDAPHDMSKTDEDVPF